MIISKKVKININPSNIKHFSKWYNDIYVHDTIEIDINHLTKGSHVEIDVKCDECGKEKKTKYSTYYRGGYRNGEWLCRTCKTKQNNQEKYGVDNVFQLNEVKEKTKQTIKEKYGVDYISQSEEIQKKIKRDFKKEQKTREKNLIEKYGVSNVFQLDEVKNKVKKTIKEKYGVDYISQSDYFKEILKKSNLKKWGVESTLQSEIVKDKIKETNYKKFGTDNPSKSKVVKDKIKSSVLKTLNKKQFDEINNLIEIKQDTFIIGCDKHDNFEISKTLFYKRRETNTTICTVCNPINRNISGLEISLVNFIEDLKVKTECNTRDVISPYELDIYIPEYKYAIEFNGVYWHNELYKPKDYHLIKSKLCKSKGIDLLHIWEDDWVYKQDIVKSMIKNKLNLTQNKIGARKCQIREISDVGIVKDFLNKNHIQGFCKSKYKIGLFYENKLVSLMLFGKNRNNEFELSRFCNIINYNVQGAFSKLLSYFLKKYNYDTIVSYSDIGYSDGGLYKNNGFIEESISKPEYYYVVDGIRKHKSNYKKSLLIKEGFDSEKSEHQIMIERNIYRVYNSGYIKWVLRS